MTVCLLLARLARDNDVSRPVKCLFLAGYQRSNECERSASRKAVLEGEAFHAVVGEYCVDLRMGKNKGVELCHGLDTGDDALCHLQRQSRTAAPDLLHRPLQ